VAVANLRPYALSDDSTRKTSVNIHYMKILAGDIGGTKTLLQLVDTDGGTEQVAATRSFASQRYVALAAIVAEFLRDHRSARPQAACFAVAGPVRDQKAKLTNLPWRLDAEQLAAQLGIGRVLLVNDMHGVGHGVNDLPDADLRVLQAGEPDVRGVRLIIAAGTGLGQGAMVWQENRYIMLPTEGGHADFAPRDELELELLRYLLPHLGQVSNEALLSGRGLIRIYEFLRDSGRASEPSHLAEALRHAQDPAAVISARGLEGSAPIAELAVDRFARIYGAVAGNLALSYLPTGGVYVAGGIAPKIIHVLERGTFISAFNRNAAMSALLERTPVFVAMCSDLCLRGAKRLAAKLLETTH
jgi:glucokinase